MDRSSIDVSIVIPVFNEEESLHTLFERLFPVMESLGRNWEVVFVNDGSRDRSLGLLLQCVDKFPGKVRVVDFNGNFGQHMAIIAGFSSSRGDIVVTMDADLQNPPEEIPRLLAEIDSGHDVVGTIRSMRKDPFFRKFASRIVNRITNRITGLNLSDYGCMLRAYSRRIIDLINECPETTTFIPALAQKFALDPTEIEVGHSEREQGTSKYGLFRLVRLNFDLMTGFSLVPLQAVTMLGLFVAASSFLFTLYMVLRRIFIGPEAEGLFTLMTINFFLMGITMFCVGIAGEYIGRIFQEIRKRPRYVVNKVYGDE
ncbi:MAG: glycosyltransferase [Thermovirgaceae bacterium]|nr:glycosyltransferase [Thermovirgaceae bacterium]